MPVELPERVAAPAPPAEFRLTGSHVLAMLLIFFAIVAGVNFYMMRQAILTMPGLDARNGYDVSQAFNHSELAAAAAQGERRWQSDAQLTLSGRRLELRLQFRDRDGKPLDGLEVGVLLAHPATRRLDRSVALAGRGNGEYGANLEGVDAGAWGLVIEARQADTGGRLFLSRHRVVLRDERR